MKNDRFWFAGRCSKEFGIVVEKCPEFQAAKKRLERISVPGRSGDLVFDTGAFENVSVSYDVWFKAGAGGTTEFSKQISTWLLSSSGYETLEDNYDSGIYRKAIFEGPVDIENWMLKRGRVKIEFNCKPQRFLKSGDELIQIQSPKTLYNPYMPASPLMKVFGKGAGTVTVGDVTVTIENISEFIVLDSEVQNAYKGTQNRNNNIKLSNHQFPKLQMGENKISFGGGVTKIELVPRWWML